MSNVIAFPSRFDREVETWIKEFSRLLLRDRGTLSDLSPEFWQLARRFATRQVRHRAADDAAPSTPV